MADALRVGKLDAVAIFQPYVAVFGKEFGGNAVTFYGETIYKSSFVVVAGKKFVLERPETVKKLLRALLKAEAFVRENPSEMRDIVARSIRKNRSEMEISFQGFDFRVKLDQSLLISMENQARWAIRSKLTDRNKVPNFLEYIYFDGLKAVRPEVVTIVR
jgi:NitT/TauT family transport system substrate-binding protein